MSLDFFKRRALEKDHLKSFFIEAVKTAAGVKIENRKHIAERLTVCRTREGGDKCRYYGKVDVVGMEFMGCIKCGCPLISKAYLKSLFGKPSTCTHEDGDKWELIDNKYK